MTTTTRTATETGIDVSDLVKQFGRNRAVDSVSLTAGRGVTGLLGPNGAGAGGRSAMRAQPTSRKRTVASRATHCAWR